MSGQVIWFGVNKYEKMCDHGNYDLIPLIHSIVDQGVDTGVDHGQPVEGQEHVGSVPGSHDGGVVEGVHEVSVVGKPAHTKYSCHSTKHFHNLKN